MKKRVCMLLSVFLALSAICGCAATPAETTAPTSETTLPPETTVPAETTEPDSLAELRENLPVMDGSTSLIPLEAGIRAALFGKTIGEATADVSHSTTWDSFYNLLEGRADLIFSVPLSAEQHAYAAEQGVELEMVPVAMEGFVFVVNAENPVDSLTQQQIRDIYAGKITNWSEVGGLDEEIIPYQRNSDSGSQNYMIEFMGDTPLMDAPTEMRPASMSGLMDVIAVNDNSRAAIGYSVYAYAADMYGNGNEIKFIQVDGVAPGKQTFADGSYPLMGYNYAIFRSGEPEDSYVRQLVEWMLTAEGQTAIAEAGYVTVTDIGYDYAEETLEKYQGTGTGPAVSEMPSSEYVLCETVTYTAPLGGEYTTTSSSLSLTQTQTADGVPSYHITQLADEALQAEINGWIDEQMVWVSQEQQTLAALVDTLNQNYDYDRYEGSTESNPILPCQVTAKNGLLSVVVALRYLERGMDDQIRYYRTETATWDLLTGERLTTEDLFCRGVDIDEVLNGYIREYTLTMTDEFSGYPELKRDFAGLPADGWHITHDMIYFDYNNPYFVQGEAISLENLPDCTLACQQLRDFGGCFAPDSSVTAIRQFRVCERDLTYAYNADSLVCCGLLEEDAHPNAGKINAEMMDYLNTYYTEAAIRGYFEDLGYDTASLDLWMMDFYTTNLGGKYLFFEGYAPELYVEESDSFVTYPHPDRILYDLETGEQISWQDILKSGWEDAVTWEDGQAPANELNAETRWFRIYNGSALQICFVENGEGYYASIPAEYFIY